MRLVINVYDFDDTIYHGDSTKRFYLYCVKKYPQCLLALPRAIGYAMKYKLKRCTKTQFKEKFYGFLRHVPNAEGEISTFWDGEIKGIQSWYLEQQKPTDMVISASPEFLIGPICSRLGIPSVIASKVDITTGHTMGENCYGEEKVRRLHLEYPQITVGKFYSDSRSDTPLAQIAEKAYLVQNNSLTQWF